MSFFRKNDDKIPTTQAHYQQMGLAAQLREEPCLSRDDKAILDQIVHSQEEGQDNHFWNMFIENPYNLVNRHFHFDGDAQAELIGIANKYKMIREDKRNYFLQTLARMQLHIQFDYILDALEEKTLDEKKKEMLHTLIPATKLEKFDPQNMAEIYDWRSKIRLNETEHIEAVERQHKQIREFEIKVNDTFKHMSKDQKKRVAQKRMDLFQRGVVMGTMSESASSLRHKGRLLNNGAGLARYLPGPPLGRGLDQEFYSAPHATCVSENMGAGVGVAAGASMPTFDTRLNPTGEILQQEDETTGGRFAAFDPRFNPLAKDFDPARRLPSST